MQIKSLRIKSYRSWRVDDRPMDETGQKRYQKISLYRQLRQEGCSEKSALQAIGVSRASCYRWQKAYQEDGVYGLRARSYTPHRQRQSTWDKHVEQQVLHLRLQFPLWGKKTLHTLLKRDRGINVSESTVGRILKKLMDQGKVKAVRFYYDRLKPKRSRAFNRHAKRWSKGMKAREIGELVQIDHMSVSIWPGQCVKHFEATCPLSKITVSQVYLNASSKTAAEFLAYVKKQLPFTLKSIQVDGGSEFRQEFEHACEQAQIPLYVLPPKSPELNGCVERCNRTLRYEFYRLYDGLCDYHHLRNSLGDYMKIYNTYRPHQALQQATPYAYYQHHFLEAQNVS